MSQVAERLSDPPAWAPNWDAVPFEVACSRCGHDLRGRTDASCPACELTFDWAEAVPIRELTCRHCGYHLYGLRETRCPECGEAFTWEEALADYHRRKIPIFEYHWRDQPIRSFVRTWWWALRPKRFWQRLDIHDPPRPGPLIVMFVGLVVTLFLAFAAFIGLNNWQLKTAKATAVWRAPTTINLPEEILSAARDPQCWTTIVAATCWACLIIVALLIFQQSMRRLRITTGHVLRIWTYSSPLMIAPIAFAGYLIRLSSQRNFMLRWEALGVAAPIALAALVFVTWSVRCAYRYYLRMPQSAAVVLTAQFLALLAFVSIDLAWATVDSDYFGIFLPLLLRLLVWT